MVNPVFNPLFAHYPQVIQQMHTDFSSHEFIARLAQEHQQEYIDILSEIRRRYALQLRDTSCLPGASEHPWKQASQE